MLEPYKKQSSKDTAYSESNNKPLAWFFIVMILLNPFLAPLLTVLLKTNLEPLTTVPDEEILDDEPEIPWDFFESIDRTLRFPMASAERLPQSSSLHRIFPEFLAGTKNHAEHEADAINTSLEYMRKIVLPFLSAESELPKIILVGEIHDSVWARKIALLNIAAQFAASHPVETIMIHEYIRDPNAIDPYLSQMRSDFESFHTRAFPLELFEFYLKNHCFDYSARTDDIQHCFLLAILAYRFELVLANSFSLMEGKARAIDAENRYLNGIFGTHASEILYSPLKAKQTDKALINTLSAVLNRASKHTVIWEFVGAVHLKQLDEFLENKGYPVLILNLANYPKAEIHYHETLQRIVEHCVMPRVKCPPLSKIGQERGLTHCVVMEPYTPEKCDSVYHEAASYHWESVKFSRNNSLVHNVPAILTSKRPKTITDFFVPRRKIHATEDTSKPTNRVEL